MFGGKIEPLRNKEREETFVNAKESLRVVQGTSRPSPLRGKKREIIYNTTPRLTCHLPERRNGLRHPGVIHLAMQNQAESTRADHAD